MRTHTRLHPFTPIIPRSYRDNRLFKTGLNPLYSVTYSDSYTPYNVYGSSLWLLALCMAELGAGCIRGVWL